MNAYKNQGDIIEINTLCMYMIFHKINQQLELLTLNADFDYEWMQTWIHCNVLFFLDFLVYRIEYVEYN